MARAARTIHPRNVILSEVELGRPLPGLPPPAEDVSSSDSEARLLVRLHGRPLGLVSMPVPAAGLEPDAQAAEIWSQLSGAIRSHLALDQYAAPDGITADGFGAGQRDACSWQVRLAGTVLASAAVIITTCGATEQLVRTIDSALCQDYPNFEVIVVDNRPATSNVRTLMLERFPGVPSLRYVAETRGGLSRARNAGLHATTADIVAFTDDDVLLDRRWLSSLVAGFAVTERVACVTGLILPVELATPAQILLEEFGGFAKGFQIRVWDLDRNRLDHPLYPYTVGIFGSGANAAFQRDALLRLGGFDDHLGAGTLARGGEDLDIYTRVVLEGYRLVYEPAALLRHAHVRDMAALSRQIRNYGVGLAAMLTKHLIEDSVTRRELVRRLPSGLAYALNPSSPKHANKSAKYPLRLTLTEFAGMAYGPVGYLRSRVAA